jgi:nucleotide-binding universal stress UspA family protein
MITLERILVPSDFSEYSDQALRYGLELARKFGATLYLLHVVTDPATQAFAGDVFTTPPAEVLDQWVVEAEQRLTAVVPDRDRARVRVRAVVGSPYSEILQFAEEEEIDLVVMGTHGRGGVSHFLLGSIAERVVRRSPCPVLTVRHPQHGFVDLPACAVTASAR